MNIQEVENDALQAMAKKAKKLKVSGVAVIHTKIKKEQIPGYSEPWGARFLTCGRLVRKAAPVSRPLDKGTNYAAVAWSKIAEMLDTGKDSGSTKETKFGTFGYRGGIVRRIRGKGIVVYIAFSGGIEDEDVAISAAGFLKYREILQDENDVPDWVDPDEI